MVTVGQGAFTYDFIQEWAKLPPGWSFKEVAGVGVDGRDRVYVFNRGQHPLMVFDRDGNFLSSWGEGFFPRPHAVTMAPDDTIFLTDDDSATVRKFTLDGKLLLTIGEYMKPAPAHSGRPFNRCTHVAIAADGCLYVSDGYGNARIHKYSPDGKLLFSWGEPGTDPGQFNVPHNIVIDRDGYLYVADRENSRIQVFDPRGRFETQFVNLCRPCALYMDRTGPEERLYVGELRNAAPVSEGFVNVGARLSVFTKTGRLLARMGDSKPGLEPGQYLAPHCICLDSRGDVYTGEVSWTDFGRLLNPPRELRTLTKLERQTAGARVDAKVPRARQAD